MPGLIFNQQLASAASPVVSKLSSTSSADAQEIRRSMLKGSRLLIVQAGYESKKFIYDRLIELGVSLTIMDDASHWSKSMVGDGGVDSFIDVDALPFEDHYERSLAALKASGLTFDGITTFWEEAVPLANRLAGLLGLPCNPLSACDIARNKGKTRELMKTSGLPAARFMRIHRADQLDAAIEEVGFPAIIKPVFGAASRGVIRCDSAEEVHAVYAELIATLTPDVDPIWAQGCEFVLEEFYDGDEFDVDVLMDDGEVVYCKVADNWACQAPYYQESGENVPSLATKSVQSELEDLAKGTLQAMGFKRGCFHVEAKYTSRGPRIVEVNARMGGMSVREVHLLAWGVDFVEEHVMSHVGIPIRPVVPEAPLRHAAMVFITAPYTGQMVEGDWMATTRAHPDVFSAKSLLAAATPVRGPEDGMPNWIGEIVLSTDAATTTTQDALRLAKDLTFAIAPPVDAKDPSAVRGHYWPSGFPFNVAVEE